MTHNTIKPSELLEGAADYIEEHGLFKGEYFEGYDPDVDPFWTSAAADFVVNGQTPKCCTVGALGMVAAQRGIELSWPELDALDPFHGIPVIPEWNDKPSQRKGRVVARLRKAAQTAREAGQ